MDYFKEINDGAGVEPTDDPMVFKNRWQIRETCGSVDVSTVFLAMDHGCDAGRPILYETLVFGGPFDQDGERYATRAEAIEGHERYKRKAESSLAASFSDPVVWQVQELRKRA